MAAFAGGFVASAVFSSEHRRQRRGGSEMRERSARHQRQHHHHDPWHVSTLSPFVGSGLFGGDVFGSHSSFGLMGGGFSPFSEG